MMLTIITIKVEGYFCSGVALFFLPSTRTFFDNMNVEKVAKAPKTHQTTTTSLPYAPCTVELTIMSENNA